LAADLYAPSVAARADALAMLSSAPHVGDDFVDAYDDAASFRLRPDQWSSPLGLALGRWARTVCRLVVRAQLGFESWRLGRAIDLEGYVAGEGALVAELRDTHPIGAWAGWLRALRDGVTLPAPIDMHPRERLARAATGLAYGGERVVARSLGWLGITSAETTPDVAHEARRRLRALAAIAG
jgi:hypothetical protein